MNVTHVNSYFYRSSELVARWSPRSPEESYDSMSGMGMSLTIVKNSLGFYDDICGLPNEMIGCKGLTSKPKILITEICQGYTKEPAYNNAKGKLILINNIFCLTLFFISNRTDAT